ncbi:MAG TPA: tetratricopeptide repeat protein [Oligoflexus sp.]|uniref:tetratricopeptide repeat protein n=1 Tax=Oligoflexus sp. TaxID=1971216 RepID=UPI002D309681|nr:tetratricopeptide repeat protein [Oligoflexus sp.]HYX32925.1 tetratricopeptide repeat protein [Oligoflexus sp.]
MNRQRRQFLINSRRLESEIETKELRIWWIAEKIKVDRKTISRWLAGTVKAAARENIQALADLLECAFDDLCLQEEPAPVAVPEPKAMAAELIRQKGLKDLLEPTHNHALLEALVSASIDPNLPPDTLAVLLLDLAHAKVRQHRYKESEENAQQALKLLMNSSDLALRSRARMALANVLSLQSKPREALDSMEVSVELARACDDELLLAKGLSNHAHTLFMMAHFQDARLLVDEALLIHDRLRASTGRTDTSNCTALRVAMLIAFSLGENELAQDYIQRGLVMARELKYRFSELLSLVFGVYAESLQPSPRQGCCEELLRYLSEIEALGHHPDACQYTVFALLNLGQGEVALEVALRTLKIETSPYDEATKNMDVAAAEWFLGRKESARKRVQEAEGILRAHGYELRADEAMVRLETWKGVAQES